MDPSGRDGVANLDLDFDEQEPDRNRLQAADALVLTDPERALREYQDLANLGSAMSLLALGLMYERGQGTVLDVSKSFEYYALASEKGSVRATFNLGRLYYNQHDFAKAEELLSVGVSKNDPRAMYWLARLYLVVKIKRKSPPQFEAFCGFSAHSPGSICQIRSTSDELTWIRED